MRTYYRLSPESKVIEHIKQFEKDVVAANAAAKALTDKYGAEGYMHVGGTIEALRFELDKEPEGWYIKQAHRKHGYHDHDNYVEGEPMKVYHFYSPKGQKKEAKAIRKELKSVRLLSFRHFQSLFGFDAFRFQDGLSIGTLAYAEDLSGEEPSYILSVPQSSDKYIPEDATEILPSEVNEVQTWHKDNDEKFNGI